MKICVISSSVLVCPPPGYSGLEAITYEQAKGLASKGHKVSLIAPEGSDFPYGELITCGPPGKWDERKSYSTYWHRLPEFDVILDSSWNKFSVILRMEGKLKAPSLLWLHAPCNTMLHSMPPNIKHPFFVCISEDQKSHFEALFSQTAKVVWNGVCPNFYQPIAGVKRTDRYLFLGRYSSVKNPLGAIQACLDAGVGLDMVGDTTITNEPQLLEQCRQLAEKSNGQIRIHGGCSRGETVAYYSRAKALIHLTSPVHYREPAGLAPIEAMLCRTPCLAWNYGALRESVKEGVSGYKVNSQEEVVSLLKSDAVSNIDREQCRNWAADNFSIEKMVNRCEQVAEESLTNPW